MCTIPQILYPWCVTLAPLLIDVSEESWEPRPFKYRESAPAHSLLVMLEATRLRASMYSFVHNKPFKYSLLLL
jgi:hypothetical protein